MLEAKHTGGQAGPAPHRELPRAFPARHLGPGSGGPRLRSGPRVRREDLIAKTAARIGLRKDSPTACCSATGRRAPDDARDFVIRERLGGTGRLAVEKPCACARAPALLRRNGWKAAGGDEEDCIVGRGGKLCGQAAISLAEDRKPCTCGFGSGRPGARLSRYLISRHRSASTGRAAQRTEIGVWKGTGISTDSLAYGSRRDPSRNNWPARIHQDRGRAADRRVVAAAWRLDPEGFIKTGPDPESRRAGRRAVAPCAARPYLLETSRRGVAVGDVRSASVKRAPRPWGTARSRSPRCTECWPSEGRWRLRAHQVDQDGAASRQTGMC